MSELPTRESGNAQRPRLLRWCLSQYKELVAAVRFLSTLPIPGSAQLFHTSGETETRLVIGSSYFPLVGLLIGVPVWLFTLVAGPYLSPLLLSALLMVFLILLTGGLHLDGLMDACDGLFAGRGRERKLEIMRDSRVGSFGVLGGVGVLLLKFALFASLTNIHQLALAFLLVLPVSRWAMVLAIYFFPSARPQGLGAAVRQVASRFHLILAGLLGLGIVLLLGHLPGLFVWLLASLLALVIGYWATRELGGLTGDLYGAIAELTEVGCFLLLVLLHF
jgi:adenosylcobinamide-GDP ribazoletransferase